MSVGSVPELVASALLASGQLASSPLVDGQHVGEAASSALLIDHHMDAELAQALAQAAEHCGISVQRWAPGDATQSEVAPNLLLAALTHGARRLPAAVMHLADEVYPGLPVVLFSDEPLVQPVITLHGGRLTLLGPPHDYLRIAPYLSAALAWRQTASGVEPAADPLAAETWRCHELKRGRAHAIWAVSDAGERLNVSASIGLTAVLSPRALPDIEVERDLLPALEAWHDQPESAHQQRLLSTRRSSAWSTLVHLDLDGGRWLLAAPEAWPVRVISRQRLPAWWDLPAVAGDGAMRVLAAEPGDVVLASAPFPALPEFAPELLAAAAAGGAAALIEHLAAAARSHRCALAAVAMELRS